jgi:hypothetical protein
MWVRWIINTWKVVNQESLKTMTEKPLINAQGFHVFISWNIRMMFPYRLSSLLIRWWFINEQKTLKSHARRMLILSFHRNHAQMRKGQRTHDLLSFKFVELTLHFINICTRAILNYILLFHIAKRLY